MGLARLAALTERVKIGTSILLLPLYPPALVAKQIADLDRATNGRVILGVGVGGEYPQEFRACQVPINERGRRTDEMIPLLRRLWTAEEITHDGRYYAMEDVRIHPVAGAARRSADRGGRAGRNRRCAAPRRWATVGSRTCTRRAATRRRSRRSTQVAAEAGRDLSSFDWYVFVFVNVNPDGDVAARRGGALDGRHLQPGLPRPWSTTSPPPGPSDEVTAKVQAFYDAGARHFVFSPATAGADPGPVIDRLFGDVVPALREHGAAQR